MLSSDIHALVLKAIIEAVEKGATAVEISDYLVQASKGMKINAAFRLSGEDLLAVLREE